MRASLIAAIAVLAVACSPHGEASQATSLVGAKKLPSPTVLAGETIIISKQGGKQGQDLLSIELRPNNTIEILHTLGTGPVRPDEHVIAKELASIDEPTGKRIRQMLWRVRPEDGADVRKTVPIGCEYMFDASYEAQVTFVESAKPIPEIFGLPLRERCQSTSWQEARYILEQALKLLPSSKTILEFPPLG